MLPLFGITIFLGAVLVFGVQPIAARMLLPSFGGSPAVWSATSVFFQLALLAGYGYSFLLTRHFAPRRQPLLHLLVLAAPIPFLPLSIPALTAAGGISPALQVIGVLTLALSVPFVVAATTGPLLQRWFSYTAHPSASDPYFLYAASNAGSLLVLLAYPFVIERRLGLESQAMAWAIGYGSFALLSVACAATVLRQAPTDGLASRREDPRPAHSLGWLTRGRWVVLTAVPSALSLGATAYISTDLAAVPLLWIAPLSLYLLSFIIAFSQRTRLSSRTIGAWLPLAAIAVVVSSTGLVHPPVMVVIALHLAFLLVAATMCHTRLAEERPEPARLTEYYLWIAVGGALGGIFVSLVAPAVFDAVWEYPLAIALALLLRPGGTPRPSRRWAIGGALVVLAALLVGGVTAEAGVPAPGVVPAAAIAVSISGAFLLLSPIRPALAAAAFAVLAIGVVGGTGSAIHADRTFFGVYRVTAEDGRHSLWHGTTLHGRQFQEPSTRDEASTYYHPTGPIGQVFAARGADLDRVAVLGLGVGTLATYGEPGQHFTFYEIDPAMVRIAQDPALFSFLRDSAATVELVVADGRLGIAADPQAFDLIVLDAFSSDAIPVHLLTREAIAAYADRLAPGGFIIANISNRYLDLEPVIGGVARSLEMSALVQHDTDLTPRIGGEGKVSSSWALIAPTRDDLGEFVNDPRWAQPRVDPDARPWSDDYSDLLAVLR